MGLILETRNCQHTFTGSESSCLLTLFALDGVGGQAARAWSNRPDSKPYVQVMKKQIESSTETCFIAVTAVINLLPTTVSDERNMAVDSSFLLLQKEEWKDSRCKRLHLSALSYMVVSFSSNAVHAIFQAMPSRTCRRHASLPTTNSLTSLYALSKSSFTMTFSCGASLLLANSISTLAWFSRFWMSASLSVARLLSRFSKICSDGGERNRKRGRGKVGWLATCLTPCETKRQHFAVAIVRETHLHLDIQDADPTLLGNVFHRLDACAVVISSKLCVLDEAALLHQVEEGLLGHEVVLSTVLLSSPRPPSRVRDAESELIGKFGE